MESSPRSSWSSGERTRTGGMKNCASSSARSPPETACAPDGWRRLYAGAMRKTPDERRISIHNRVMGACVVSTWVLSLALVGPGFQRIGHQHGVEVYQRKDPRAIDLAAVGE